MSQQLTAVDQMTVTEFHCGRVRGPCLQFNMAQLGQDYAQLTRGEVYTVMLALQDWLNRHAGEVPR